MNDTSERQHGMDLLNDVLQKEKNRSRNVLFKAYCEASEAMLRGMQTDASYVFCLSSEGNQLSQWRAYAANGGYCIGFDSAKLLQMFRADEPTARLQKVVYSQTVQVTRFRSVVHKYFNDFSNTKDFDRSDALARLHRFAHEEVGEDELIDVLNELYPLWLRAESFFSIFKNPAYREEAEWRLVLMHVLSKTNQPSGFRASPDFLIPYRAIKPKERHKLPISSIRVGPRENPHLSNKAVEDALWRFGYGNARINVLDSEIPLRQLKTVV